jgi:hypothetical protein
VFGYRYLIYKHRTQVFDGLNGCVIVRVTGQNHFLVNRSNERCQRAARLQGVTMPSETFLNRIPDVAGAQPHMFSCAHSKINVANLTTTGGNNLEVIERGETNRTIARNNVKKAQRHIAM